jgi:hypothetical protein
VATKPALRFQVLAYDRLFYSTVAIAMALTIVVGFAPTFYLKAFVGEPMVTISGSSFTPLIHLHGILFTAWAVLFIVQTALVASHRVALHRRLGVAGGLLAAGMVLIGTATAINAAARGGGPPGVDPLVFLAIPLSDMLLFAGFVTAGLLLRTDREAHKRLMVLAYISIMAAAVARLPGVLPLGPLGFFGLAFVFLLLAVVYDLITRRAVHKVYIWGGALLVISVPLRLMLSGTGSWKTFAQFVTR